jgi:hypothetical protein
MGSRDSYRAREVVEGENRNTLRRGRQVLQHQPPDLTVRDSSPGRIDGQAETVILPAALQRWLPIYHLNERLLPGSLAHSRNVT